MKRIFSIIALIMAACLSFNSCLLVSSGGEEENIEPALQFSAISEDNLSTDSVNLYFEYLMVNPSSAPVSVYYTVCKTAAEASDQKNMKKADSRINGIMETIELRGLDADTKYYSVCFIKIGDKLFQSRVYEFQTLPVPEPESKPDTGDTGSGSGSSDSGSGSSSDSGSGSTGSGSGSSDSGSGSQTVAVTGIKLVSTESSITMKVGEKKPVYAEVIPSNASNRGITWSMENNTVAAYFSGVITIEAKGHSSYVIEAKSKGTAKLTAKSTEGNFTTTINITVTE